VKCVSSASRIPRAHALHLAHKTAESPTDKLIPGT
jgi:hypothetical protein